MSLRFTDTNKWEDDWFLALSPLHKLIHGYLYDKCDVAGVWKIGLTDLKFRTGATEQDWKAFLGASGTQRIVILPGMSAIWLLDFIPDQNPRGLTPRNPTVAGIVRSVLKNQAPWERLPSPYQAPLKSFIINNEQGAMKGLTSPQGIGEGKGESLPEGSAEGNQDANEIPTLKMCREFASHPTCAFPADLVEEWYNKSCDRGWGKDWRARMRGASATYHGMRDERKRRNGNGGIDYAT